ncbi:tyrosine--tRNA ligase 1, cytoplasmic-like [Panicum hallii]|uniref:tyrosine--tRNA ligase 1, cytoplasmic-like n=1 Tax=Panicum hallii TaxID=206008 RepID=UPI000DF4EF95|nr:tyrosine--tRNA ligase 1, cytoplasmic-like [Panicum hallii]
MGRSEKDALTATQIMYPLMQCAHILFLKVDICQMGLDQRKVNMLARDYCEASKRNSRPIILSRHMSSGIKEGQQKMSKSDPSSAIFMEDSESQVNEKIRLAFCPHKVTEGNLCLEYIEYIVLPKSGRFAVLCKETDGSNRAYSKIEQLHEEYRSGTLHPDDVKLALAKAINEILQPVRDHFEKHPDAQALLDTVKAYRRTGGSQMQSGGDHTSKEPERRSA